MLNRIAEALPGSTKRGFPVWVSWPRPVYAGDLASTLEPMSAPLPSADQPLGRMSASCRRTNPKTCLFLISSVTFSIGARSDSLNDKDFYWSASRQVSGARPRCNLREVWGV